METRYSSRCFTYTSLTRFRNRYSRYDSSLSRNQLAANSRQRRIILSNLTLSLSFPRRQRRTGAYITATPPAVPFFFLFLYARTHVQSRFYYFLLTYGRKSGHEFLVFLLTIFLILVSPSNSRVRFYVTDIPVFFFFVTPYDSPCGFAKVTIVLFIHDNMLRFEGAIERRKK